MKKEILYLFGLLGGIKASLYSRNHESHSNLLQGGATDSFLHGYGHDIAMPFMIYFTGRSVGWSKKESSIFPLLGCAAFEVLQKMGSYPGTFDPKDFLAYATGVGLAVAIENFTLDSAQCGGKLEEITKGVK